MINLPNTKVKMSDQSLAEYMIPITFRVTLENIDLSINKY